MIIDTIAMCALTIIPVRAHHEDPAEIVTQLFFGEAVKIIDKKNQWLKIKNLHDQYKGWVDRKQLLLLNSKELDLSNHQQGYQQEKELVIISPWGEQNVLQGSPILSSLPSFQIEEYKFSWKKETPTPSKESIEDIALSYLNVPYLWGGRSKYGIDCSGLSQTVYHQANISIPRDASLQVQQGKEVKFSEQQIGDLAFFKSEISGRITHVGIVLPNKKIIHAHGRVRIDKLDEIGIYNQEEEYYSHKLYNIKRYINTNQII